MSDKQQIESFGRFDTERQRLAILGRKRIVFKSILDQFQREGLQLPEDVLHDILWCWNEEVGSGEELDNPQDFWAILDSKMSFIESLLERLQKGNSYSPDDVKHDIIALWLHPDRVDYWVEKTLLEVIFKQL